MTLHRRAAFVALALATIVIGMLVHFHGMWLGVSARDATGDALWAMMIASWMGAFTPHVPVERRGFAAYAVCTAVELSQLYHSSSIDAVRGTRLGHLLLGSGFDARDLLAYAVGVAGAALIERVTVSRKRSATRLDDGRSRQG